MNVKASVTVKNSKYCFLINSEMKAVSELAMKVPS